MHPYITYLNNTVNKNNELIKEKGIALNWVNTGTAYQLEEERNTLLKELDNVAEKSYANSKLWANSLSKGCQLCAEGKWSCLFINNICNASCEFCPTQQDTDEIPATQGCSFNTPEEFADYINYFNFKGVSISGGEPLKTLNKTISYLKAVRQNCDPGIYFWLYSNGILGTPEIFKSLGEAGLNEVRFNLAASNYKVSLVENATPYIKNITVEIPAIPEDFEKVKELIPQLITAGVTNLNLHQLRLTPYNAGKLVNRGYTITHGNPPTMVDSELTALKLLKYVIDSKLNIGVNYCNYHYKNNFQKAGFRKHIAQKFEIDNHKITDLGYIRKIKSIDNPEFNNIEVCDLQNGSHQQEKLKLSYKQYVLNDISTTDKCEKIHIGSKEYNLFLKNRKSNLQISSDEFLDTLNCKNKKEINQDVAFEVFQKEIIEGMLPEYF